MAHGSQNIRFCAISQAALAAGVANGKTGGPRRSQAAVAGLSALGHAGRRAAPPSALYYIRQHRSP